MVRKQLGTVLDGCLSLQETAEGGASVLAVKECSRGPEQSWSLSRSGQLKAYDGTCAMFAPIGATRGTEVVAGDCGEVPEQRWRLYPSDSAAPATQERPAITPRLPPTASPPG